jgi:hypothetical protein
MALGPVVSKKLTESTGVTGFAATFGGCSIAGVIAASLSHPFDTIKTVVQGDVDSKTYKGPGHAYKLLLEEGGPARFFSGWAWRTSRMIGALFIIGESDHHCSELNHARPRAPPSSHPAAYVPDPATGPIAMQGK